MENGGQVSPQAKLPFIPLSSLPFLVNHNPKFKYLNKAFMFGPKVEAEWISYDPNRITMLTANEMFVPMYPTPSILNIDKQTIKVTNNHELRQLQHMFSKPTIICVTRRQIDELGVLGFDSEFVLIINRSDPLMALKFHSIKSFIQQKLRKNKRFHLTVDLTDVLQNVTPSGYERFVSWSNCSFHITNHSRPHPVLGLDPLIVSCILTPFSLFATLPYKAYRKISCTDMTMNIDAKLSLDYSELSPLILHFYNDKLLFSGLYKKHKHKYFCRICSSCELTSLLDLENCYELE